MTSVTFPPALGGDGSTVTDDVNPSTGLANGGHRTRFVPALSQTVVMAQTAVTQAGNAANSASAAAASAAAALAAPGGNGTSTTSLTIGTGAKSLTIQTGKTIVPGMPVQIARTSDPANSYMHGIVTSYTSGTGALAVSADYALGSGTFTDWTISLTAPLDASRAPLASPAFTGNPTAPTASVGDNDTSIATTAFVQGEKNVQRSARTSNTSLGLADKGWFIDITSGTFTQTFDAVSTLPDGWWVWLRNSGTGDITLDPNASETIDALTSYIMYPGECRFVQKQGSAFNTFVISGFNKTFTASGNFIKPPGYTEFDGLLWGGGASGGKGGIGAGGGGGGACVEFNIPASVLSASTAVTIAAGGTGQTTASSNGNNGGNSTFATVTAYGGAGGRGASSSGDGGGGGGALSAGSTTTGGEPRSIDSTDTTSGYSSSGQFGGGQGGTVNASFAYAGQSTGYGGAGGGAGRTDGTAAVNPGGSSLYGGAGGGAVSNSAAVSAGGTSVHGGAGGAGVDAASGVAGTAPAGGGGATRTGTSSGAGARGEMRIRGKV